MSQQISAAHQVEVFGTLSSALDMLQSSGMLNRMIHSTVSLSVTDTDAPLFPLLHWEFAELCLPIAGVFESNFGGCLPLE